MPSLEHEMLVELLREHPELVLALLRATFGITIDGDVEVAASPENLTEIQPPQRRADLVLIVQAPGSGVATYAAIALVQLRRDARKRWTWPAYQAVLRARLACPVQVVVVSLDEDTARWCAEPIELDGLGLRLCPMVIGGRRGCRSSRNSNARGVIPSSPCSPCSPIATRRSRSRPHARCSLRSTTSTRPVRARTLTSSWASSTKPYAAPWRPR